MIQPARTIPEALLATAERGEGEYVFHLEEGVVRLSCAELAERAERAARRLVALGVEPGDAVGVLGPNRPDWVIWAFAAWIAGAALVPVQVPLRIRDPGVFREQLRRLVVAADCRCVMAASRFASLLPQGVGVAWEEGAGEASAEQPPAPHPGSSAVIQFTSGSTATPRGAVVAHSAVMAQMDILDELLRDGERLRSTANWTPFFHDLGLFLNVLPAARWGLTSHHLPTERFAREPGEWLRLIDRSRAAVTITPSAAFGRAVRAIEGGEPVDLGCLEAVRFAAEGTDPQVVQQALDGGRRIGLRPEALGSSYGLAEAVLAVCYSPPGSGLRLDRISLGDLAERSLATPCGTEPSRLLAGCGRPKMDLRIVAPSGQELPDRHVGEIQLRGPSLMTGYVGPGADDPFVDGWMRSGDLGYLTEGELYVTGRLKDVMIAMGHNYYPEDFEWAAARVEAVRPGRCVAFNVTGTEEVVVVVEPKDGLVPAGMERAVREAIISAVGVPPAKVVVAQPGTVQKTTSGKLRRGAMREAYASGGLAMNYLHSNN